MIREHMGFGQVSEVGRGLAGLGRTGAGGLSRTGASGFGGLAGLVAADT